GSSRPATSSRSSRSLPATAMWAGGRSTNGPPACTSARRRRFSAYDLPVATFRVDFLGCKVSHADVHEVREALLRDGHAERRDERADVAVISTCCVTNEAV